MEPSPSPTPTPKPAGFWRRFLALIIDWAIVSTGLFPLVLLLGIVVPDQIVVSVPMDLFTVERTLTSAQSREEHSDQSVTALETRWIEVTCLNRWTYLYKETTEHNAGEAMTSRQLVDPVTREALDVTTTGDLTFWVIFAYWILMESSVFQASIGKRALGIRVTDVNGAPLTFSLALGRNLLKLLSGFIVFIGFMMAGWTDKKQALHDKLTDCLVVRQPPMPGTNDETG